MEEVDEIVIHTLRQIGCDVEEINSLKEFNTEIVIQGVVRCLKLINPNLELPHHVPPSMSARYRLGSTLASACVDLGYKGEIGYQTFLYSNETDIRKIFLFLFEKLPKESEKALDEPLNKIAVILKETASFLSLSLHKPWLPDYCRSQCEDGGFFVKRKISCMVPYRSCPVFQFFNYSNVRNKNAVTKYCKNFLDRTSKQISPQSRLMCSILESNTLTYVKEVIKEKNQNNLPILNEKELIQQRDSKIQKLLSDQPLQVLQHKKLIYGKLNIVNKNEERISRGSRFTNSLQLQFTSDKKETVSLPNIHISKDETEEVKQKKREQEIEELQEKMDLLTSKLEELVIENKKYEATSQSIVELIKKEEENIEKIKETYRVKKCTLSLLPNAEVNIEKLQELIDSSSQRLVSLANQWEQHRVPLIDQYRELKELSSRRVSETQRKLEEIKELREKITNLGLEMRQKEDAYKHLLTAYEKLTKDVSRSAYTRRIMEIVGNIKKQKSEIDKVLLDTRSVQKEINRLIGKLERTFSVTDELVFRDAKKDEAVRRAYKYLAALHENSNQLVQIVEETGYIIREIRELEDQIEQENQKKVMATLERITSDYKQMQRENASLLEQLKNMTYFHNS